jgi:DNA mismatch endonuclease (patch repair protein)
VFVDGCFWHSCPEHSHLPKTNTNWWRLKFRGIARRDRDTQLAAGGWLVVRIWEHQDPAEAAETMEQLARDRTTPGKATVPDSCLARHAHVPAGLEPPRP